MQTSNIDDSQTQGLPPLQGWAVADSCSVKKSSGPELNTYKHHSSCLLAHSLSHAAGRRAAPDPICADPSQEGPGSPSLLASLWDLCISPASPSTGLCSVAQPKPIQKWYSSADHSLGPQGLP